jgi:hypothetical protein
MPRLSWLIFGVIVGGLCMWGSFQYHVVRTNDGLTYVPKQRATLTDTYVDVRKWGVAEWGRHPELVLSLSQHGHKELVGNADTLEATLKDALKLK